MTSQWYVVRSKPREETAAWHYLMSMDVTCFCPCLEVNPINPRARKVIPYFPDYLFVFCDLDLLGNNTFRWMSHSHGLVSFCGQPAPVPDNVIACVRKTLTAAESGCRQEACEFQAGDCVLVERGAFQGYQALFDKSLLGGERVCVLLKMLGENREVPLELDRSWIRIN